MRKVILFLFVFVSFLQLFSQEEKKYISFAGFVQDTLTQEPLQYATVRLLDVQNNLCFGAVTDDKGAFNTDQIICKSYILITSFVGYKTDTIYVDSSCNKKNIRFVINLSPQLEQLSDVEIIAQKTGNTVTIDRDVFVPDSSQLRLSVTGLDLLDHVPGITVSQSDQSVTFMGDENILVLVNGVNSGRNLNAIDAKNIKQIETIKAPTPEYDSEINTVINIILKEEEKQGFYTILQLDYYTQNKYNNSNVQLDYNFKKIRIFGMYKLYLNNSISTSDAYRWNGREDSEYERISKSIGSRKLRSSHHTFQYGMDYRIDKNNLFNFTGQFQFQDGKGYPGFTENCYYRNDSLTNWNIVNSESLSNNKLQNYNLYYKHSFKNPKQQLSIITNFYNMSGNPSSKSNAMEYFAQDSSRQIIRTRNEDNNYYSTDTKVDYLHPFSENFDSQWGLQFTTRHIREKQYLNNEIIDNFNYQENRVMPYLNFIYRLNSFNFMAGLRAERQNFNFHNSTKVNKWNFLPSITILHNTKKIGNFRLSYRTTLQYPQYKALSPFVYYSADSLSISTGNPYLRPTKINTLDFTHSYQISQLYLSVSLYCKYTYDLPKMERIFLDNNVLFLKYENIENSQEYGIRFYGKNKFLKILTANMNATLSYLFFPQSEYNGFYYFVSPSIAIELPANFFITARATVTGKNRRYEGYYKFGPSINNISIKKNLFKDKASITFSILNIINKPAEFVTWNNDYYEHNLYTYKNFCLMLRFNYSFNYGKKYDEIKRELNMEHETK
jgi:hypothetical protein